ncbi:MAG: nucleoside-diphosphate kinase [Candidatus Babeliaceae bacterium]
MNKTLAIIKPHATLSLHSGDIIRLIELNKFTIVRMIKTQLTRAQGEVFYAVHKAKPFFGELVDNISSGPLIVMALEKDNAITEWRELMGATNPEKAAVGTIRKMFGKDIGSNAVHGSDAPETAKIELEFFFPDLK